LASVGDFDPFTPETVECPYDFYAALRPEAPVYSFPGGSCWVVRRFEDCRQIALAPRVFSSTLVAMLMAETTGRAEQGRAGSARERPRHRSGQPTCG
jgi:cytochrome P450